MNLGNLCKDSPSKFNPKAQGNINQLAGTQKVCWYFYSMHFEDMTAIFLLQNWWNCIKTQQEWKLDQTSRTNCHLSCFIKNRVANFKPVAIYSHTYIKIMPTIFSHLSFSFISQFKVRKKPMHLQNHFHENFSLDLTKFHGVHNEVKLYLR